MLFKKLLQRLRTVIPFPKLIILKPEDCSFLQLPPVFTEIELDLARDLILIRMKRLGIQHCELYDLITAKHADQV